MDNHHPADLKKVRLDIARNKSELLKIIKKATASKELIVRTKPVSEKRKAQAILAWLCETLDVPHDQVDSRIVRRDITIVRQMYYFLALNLTALSQEEVAQSLDRDRTTVVKGLKKFRDVMSTEPEFEFVTRYLEMEASKLLDIIGIPSIIIRPNPHYHASVYTN